MALAWTSAAPLARYTGFGGGALDPETWPPRWVPESARRALDERVGAAGRGAPTVKAWPACFGHNSALTALFSLLLEPDFDRTRIGSIDVCRPTEPTDSATFRTDPKTGLEAKFSVPFVMAAAWLDGLVDVDTFRDDNSLRIVRSGQLARIRVIVDPSLAARGESGEVTLHLKDGPNRAFPLGRGLALQGAGVVAKFRHNVTPLLGPDQASAIAERLMRPSREPHLRLLLRTLGAEPAV